MKDRPFSFGKLLSVIKKPAFLLLLAVLLVSTIIKITAVKGYNFPFTMDQGRDLTDIRQMIVTRTPRLVGPTTSINGVLLGPFWYYFNLVPFLFFGGNPSAIVYWQIFWFQLSIILLYLVLQKKNGPLAFFASALLLLAPFGFNTGRYFWNANSMPIFTTLFLVSVIWSGVSSSKYRHLLTGLIAGLSLQIEAAFGVLFFPFLFIYRLFSKEKSKNIFWSIAGFVVTLIPQVIFEFRHGFIMTKIFFDEFTGSGQMLGEKITFSEKLAQRGEHLVDIIRHTNHLPENLVFIFTAIAFVSLLFYLFSSSFKKADKKIPLLLLGFLVFSSVFYLAFPQKLKIWYTLGLAVPLIMVDAVFLALLYRSHRYLLRLLSVLFVTATFVFSLKAQNDYFSIMYDLSANNPSNLQNEIAAADWIYTEAAGQGFAVYSYLPSVYDYPYQHVFWWYGTQKYGYQPADTAYLPNQPEYILRGNQAWKKKKEQGDNQLTFLIIERESETLSRQQAWLGNFSSLCAVKQHTFSWGTEVRKLEKCR